MQLALRVVVVAAAQCILRLCVFSSDRSLNAEPFRRASLAQGPEPVEGTRRRRGRKGGSVRERKNNNLQIGSEDNPAAREQRGETREGAFL